jgi:hypothetical protein
MSGFQPLLQLEDICKRTRHFLQDTVHKYLRHLYNMLVSNPGLIDGSLARFCHHVPQPCDPSITYSAVIITRMWSSVVHFMFLILKLSTKKLFFSQSPPGLDGEVTLILAIMVMAIRWMVVTMMLVTTWSSTGRWPTHQCCWHGAVLTTLRAMPNLAREVIWREWWGGLLTTLSSATFLTTSSMPRYDKMKKFSNFILLYTYIVFSDALSQP